MKTVKELLKEYAASGSEAAFEEVVKRHGHQIYASALRRTNNAEQSRDIAQAVFIILSRKAGEIAMKASPVAWLMKITRCVTIDHLRSERARKNA